MANELAAAAGLCDNILQHDQNPVASLYWTRGVVIGFELALDSTPQRAFRCNSRSLDVDQRSQSIRNICVEQANADLCSLETVVSIFDPWPFADIERSLPMTRMIVNHSTGSSRFRIEPLLE